MPVRTPHLSRITRLVVYAAALVALATARLPLPRLTTSVSTVRMADPGTTAPNVAWRLAIAGVLLTGVVIDVSRRRAVWH